MNSHGDYIASGIGWQAFKDAGNCGFLRCGWLTAAAEIEQSQ
jgi:hypothetical protein